MNDGINLYTGSVIRAMDFKYCPYCASPLTMGRSEGDLLERLQCTPCGFTHYRSPKVLVSTLATFEGKLLWIRRGTRPQKGLWASPGGFMEEYEQPEQTAARELFEETRVSISPEHFELFAIGSLPEMNQVYLVYRGEMTDRTMETTDEAMEVGLFSEEEAPWAKQAYPDLEDVVRCFYSDHKQQDYGVYCCVYKDGVHRYRDTVRQIKQLKQNKFITN
jgi:ADP-ribose pyrophosphatase YjhB (NUDIX family)